MGYRITVIEKFSASHFLRGYSGDCSRVHGHNYIVEVTVEGEEVNELGFLMDFRDLKKLVKDVIKKFDHHMLNEVEPFKEELNPTSENIARYIYQSLTKHIHGNCSIKEVKIGETDSTFAVYRKE